MTAYQKFGLVAGQIFIGFFGAMIFAIAVLVFFSFIQITLFDEILYALIGAYVGMLAGIGYDGFKYLKRNRRKNDFLTFFGQSFIGMIVGLLLVYLSVCFGFQFKMTTPSALINFLLIALPLARVVIGFDFQLIRNIEHKGGD